MKKLPRRNVIILCIVLAVVVFVSLISPRSTTHPVKFGVTFTPRYAGYLNLDWQKTYQEILDDLKVKNLRIPTYWDILEPSEGKYDFAQTDYLLNEAAKRGAKVILVLGVRQPRWPECHLPAWVKTLSVVDRQQKLLQFVQKSVQRYQDHPAVWAWQVENEPLLRTFGEGCDLPNKNFLKKEVVMVRSISRKPIIMTDSGELGFWVTAMQEGDIFGTTLYRQVYDKLFGYTTYPLSPIFYQMKSTLVRNIFAPDNKKTIIVELQAEPWLANGTFVSPQQQAKLLTLADLRKYVAFSQRTGFNEAYLWGVEWWYFMAVNGHPEYLNYAKTLLK